MRLISYNIHKGRGNDRRYRFERVIGVIEEANPDLICLQEVDCNVRRSNFDDQPRLLAEHFRAAAYTYQLNVPRLDGGYGNLILSRWPFLAQADVSLRLRKRKPRAAQLVVVNTPEGPLHLVNCHLGLRERERRWQVHHLLHHDAFRAAAHLPTVIAGDYNDWRNTLERTVFTRYSFSQATSPLGAFRSFPSFLAVTALDKLFYRGELAIREARIWRTALARRASDHLPLVVDLQLVCKAEGQWAKVETNRSASASPATT
jgi:endonuclease/exonuclease/phosphatase family metal-dependent hydrolase